MIITLLVAQGQYASCAFAENEEDNTTAVNEFDGGNEASINNGRDTFKNQLGMRFAFISGGEFIIGSPPEEPGRTIFEVQQAVYVDKPFYIQMTEVTQQQWKEVMNHNPSYFSGCGDNCPVESVSWLDVQAFIKKLNHLDSNNTYRLPTEAEWEYVCRSGSMTAFSNGALINFDCQENNPLDEMAWYHCNSHGKVHAVAQKMPNDWGIYDMHGNVYEWCQDVYVADYTKKIIMKENRDLDPIADRVGRSCSFDDAAVSCRSAARVNIDPQYQVQYHWIPAGQRTRLLSSKDATECRKIKHSCRKKG